MSLASQAWTNSSSSTMSSGTSLSDVQALPLRLRGKRSVRFTRVEGTSPEKLLWSMKRVWRAVKVPTSAGKGPLILLLLRKRIMWDLSLLVSAGKMPLM